MTTIPSSPAANDQTTSEHVVDAYCFQSVLTMLSEIEDLYMKLYCLQEALDKTKPDSGVSLECRDILYEVYQTIFGIKSEALSVSQHLLGKDLGSETLIQHLLQHAAWDAHGTLERLQRFSPSKGT